MDKKLNTIKRAQRILEIAMNMAMPLGYAVQNRIEEIVLHSEGYSEPGYSSDSGLVATGNWNVMMKWDNTAQVSTTLTNLPERIGELFDRMGIDCEWCDEWIACEDCGGLVRIEPDSYGWTRSFYVDEENCSYQCINCLKKDPESYLECLEGSWDSANTMSEIDPANHGYVLVNEESYQTGFHPGQNDDPKTIAKGLQEKGISRFLFNIDEVRQFDSDWSVYVHMSESHLLNGCDCEDCDGDCDSCEAESFCASESSTEGDCSHCQNTHCISADVDERATKSHETFIMNKNDCPCKGCGTGLNAGETPCWKCGMNNPTN